MTAKNDAETKWLRQIKQAQLALEAAKQVDAAFLKLNQSHASLERYALHLSARALREQAELSLADWVADGR